MERADIIVIGLGAMGSAAAYQAVRRGARVIGIDRFSPPHDRGSSHGETRITREAVGEGDIYVPFARRSHALWREIEAETGASLFVACGGLFIEAGGVVARAEGKEDFLSRTIRAAESFGVDHEALDASAIAARYPQFSLVGDERGYFEPGAGFLRPEACIAAQLALARRGGASLRLGETATRIVPASDHVRVETDAGVYEAGVAIVAAGAWTSDLVGTAAGPLGVHRQVLFWFETQAPEAFAPDRFPVFIWTHGDRTQDWFYGFPTQPGSPGVKIAAETFADPKAGPDEVTRLVGPNEAAALHRDHVAGRVPGIRPTCLRAETCLYTATPDHHFLIDRHPDSDRVLLVSACSGHGFKHSAAIGEAAAERALEGVSRLDLSPFSIRPSRSSTSMS